MGQRAPTKPPSVHPERRHAQSKPRPRRHPHARPTHNDDPAFTRSRVRHTALPVLERELGPGIAAALARTATLVRDDSDALDDWARRERETCVRDGADGALGRTSLSPHGITETSGGKGPTVGGWHEADRNRGRRRHRT